MSGICGAAYCDEAQPEAGMESALGGRVVNGTYYCASHYYGPWLQDKRERKREEWERGKAEFDQRRQERQRAARAENEPPAEEQPSREWWADRVIRERAERRQPAKREWWADRVIRERREREEKRGQRRS